MYTTNLRKVGGSTMLSVPPAVLDLLHLQAGATVSLAVEGQNLIIQPLSRTHYSLEELLDQCDPEAPITAEDQAWLDMASVGREL